MATTSRTALAKEFMEVFATRNADAVMARMTDDPTWVFWGSPRHGSEGVLSILKAASELYQPDSMTRSYQGEYEDGDVAILQSTLCATTFKGEDYENRYVMFVHFDGDKVSKVEEYLDTAYANSKFSGWEE
jgi:ketosteroid isomerase-like protein